MTPPGEGTLAESGRPNYDLYTVPKVPFNVHPHMPKANAADVRSLVVKELTSDATIR